MITCHPEHCTMYMTLLHVVYGLLGSRLPCTPLVLLHTSVHMVSPDMIEVVMTRYGSCLHQRLLAAPGAETSQLSTDLISAGARSKPVNAWSTPQWDTIRMLCSGLEARRCRSSASLAWYTSSGSLSTWRWPPAALLLLLLLLVGLYHHTSSMSAGKSTLGNLCFNAPGACPISDESVTFSRSSGSATRGTPRWPAARVAVSRHLDRGDTSTTSGAGRSRLI
mmetsp:Transcript_4494/g.9669  ORF Transcript_4494/g.9669 Transcript_4494/m.9669 type:complete len:222 (+) Transcript_4494:181-846(+)